jgi:hypothetical protein
MKTRLNFCAITFLSVAILFAAGPDRAGAEPRVKTITLESHTNLTAHVVPNLGVRFIFPFVLDESDDFIPFTAQPTNPSFSYKREAGRNSFVVWIDPKAGLQSGNLFVTVAGYLISIELKTSTDPSLFYSDINFVLGTADRENIIQKGIKQRTAALEAEYKKKFEDLENQADQKAISKVGVLAMVEPIRTRIKEQSTLSLPNGDTLTLFVDQSLKYGAYTMVTFDLRTDAETQGLSVLDAKLFSVNMETKNVRPIDAAKDLPKRITPKDSFRGVLTTLDSTLNQKEQLKLQVLTDKGLVEAKW